jgi:phage terminase large subunit-like protein
MPQNLNIVLRLNFCVWTEAADRWMDMEAWDACGTLDDEGEEALLGRPCFIGIDLSSTTDFSAMVATFPPQEDGESWRQLEFYWIPEEKVRFHVERDLVPCTTGGNSHHDDREGRR